MGMSGFLASGRVENAGASGGRMCSKMEPGVGQVWLAAGYGINTVGLRFAGGAYGLGCAGI